MQVTSESRSKLLLGLIGTGIARSLTPALHEAEAALHGVRLHYQLIDLDRTSEGDAALPALLSAVRLIGFDGFNVTYPCKQTIIPLLDELTADARGIGAVNTVIHRDGRLVGHNTDGAGWAWGFERALPEADLSRVVLLGAGGAGAAVAHAALRMGVEQLAVHDVDPERSAALVAALERRHGAHRARVVTELAAEMKTAVGLIHATPTGMEKSPGIALPAELLQPSHWVCELVYFPIETVLLRAARAAGCRTVDGGFMAVGQAIHAFRLFTGREPDEGRMYGHLRRMLAERT